MSGGNSDTTSESDDVNAAQAIGRTLQQFGIDSEPYDECDWYDDRPSRRPHPLLMAAILVLLFLAGIAFGMSL